MGVSSIDISKKNLLFHNKIEVALESMDFIYTLNAESLQNGGKVLSFVVFKEDLKIGRVHECFWSQAKSKVLTCVSCRDIRNTLVSLDVINIVRILTMADNVLGIQVFKAIDVRDIIAQIEAWVSKNGLVSPISLPNNLRVELRIIILEQFICETLLCSIHLC